MNLRIPTRYARLPHVLLFIYLWPQIGIASDPPAGATDHAPYFRIDVVDQETGRGIPGVRLALSETSGVVYISDSAGAVAFLEPGLSDTDLCFHIAGDGYVLAPDHPDRQRVTLRVTPGGQSRIELRRQLAAQRLYRIGGLDPYRDSRLLGTAPHYAPPLRAKIFGQDSAFVTKYRDRLFWIWGDTTGPGPRQTWNYEVAGATSQPPGQGELDPNLGVDLDYFLNPDGFTKPMVGPASGGGLTWFDGLVTLQDADRRERLFALYVQMRRVASSSPRSPGEAVHPVGIWWPDDTLAKEIELIRRRELGEEAVRAYLAMLDRSTTRETRVTRGLMEFNPDTRYFERLATFPAHEIDELHIGSHALRVKHEQQEYVYFSGLAPNRRIQATVEAIRDISRYESFTCLTEGLRFNGQADQLDRDPQGRLRYGWKTQTSPIGPLEQAQLVASGQIAPHERWFVLRDVRTGAELSSHHHSIQWNPFRQRYVGLFSCGVRDTKNDDPGASTPALNATWYGEADTILGPWGYLEKVVDLGDYAYYNPLLNPYFNQDSGRVVFFEGTYTSFLGGGKGIRPRYNYNQVMHKLELDDPRVILPTVVYEIDGACRLVTLNDIPAEYDAARVARFLAPDRPRPGCVPIYEIRQGTRCELSTTAAPPQANQTVRTAFYAKPPAAQDRNCTSVPLFAARNDAGEIRYLLDGDPPADGFRRDPQPVCCVWELTTSVNPGSSTLGTEGR